VRRAISSLEGSQGIADTRHTRALKQPQPKGAAPSILSGADMSVEDFFELSLDNACIAGFDGYFKRVNPSWTRTLGWTEQELLARPSIDFVHPDDKEMTLAGRSRLRDGGALGHLVNRYLCKDGTYRWFEWRSVAELNRGLVFASARDITEQKLAEMQLREAQAGREQLEQQLILASRMASVGTLAAGVAHEINNPLAQLSGNLAMLLEDIEALRGPPTPEHVRELKDLALEAQAGAERIRKIVQGMQTFSRAEDERRAVVELGPLLEVSIGMVFNEIRHRARLIRELGATPPVEADEARLGQVFINLLLNAAQAVRESDQAKNEIRIVTSTDAEGRAVIEFHDNGVGVPADIADRIFEPFFTTKPVSVGSGLGLSICRNVVAGLGGQIGVSSKHGAGATFRVVLPPAPSLVAPASCGASSRSRALRRLRSGAGHRRRAGARLGAATRAARPRGHGAHHGPRSARAAGIGPALRRDSFGPDDARDVRDGLL
jgi:PAS domain S-box-containing protein